MRNNILNNIKKAYYSRNRLPVGRSEFEAWSKSIQQKYNLITGNSLPLDHAQFALAAMIVNMGATDSHKPKSYFLKSLIKSSANQVAGQYFIEIKEKQKKQLLEDEQKKQQSEVTETNTEHVISDGHSGAIKT